MACTCNPPTLEGEFRKSIDAIPVGGKSPLEGGWIVRTPLIQFEERNLTK